MTVEEILGKVSSGELSGDSLAAETANLEPQDLVTLRSKMADMAKEEFGKVNGFRQEKQRLETLVSERKAELDKMNPPAPAPTNPAPATDETMKQFREEQKQKAIKRLQTELGVSAEDLTKVQEVFAKLDSGKIDADHIYDELVGVYAFINKDALIAANTERLQREANAAAETAAQAGGAQGAPLGSNPPKYAPEVTAFAKKAGISEDAAQRLATQGTKRVYQ